MSSYRSLIASVARGRLFDAARALEWRPDRGVHQGPQALPLLDAPQDRPEDRGDEDRDHQVQLARQVHQAAASAARPEGQRHLLAALLLARQRG